MSYMQTTQAFYMNKTDVHQYVTRLALLHGPMVFATAYRLVGDPATAEDIQQEVFLKLLGKKKPGFWDEVENWPAYLRVMTQNQALDFLRRHREKSLSKQTPEPVDERVPSDDVLLQQRARQLRNALGKLSAKDAQLFSLRFIEGLSIEQLAKQFDSTTNSIGVALHRAKTRLQKALRLTEDA